MDEQFEQRVKDFVKKAKKSGLDPLTINSFIKRRYQEHMLEKEMQNKNAWSIITDEDGNPVGRFNAITGEAEPFEGSFPGAGGESGWSAVEEDYAASEPKETEEKSSYTFDETGDIQTKGEPNIMERIRKAEQKPSGKWPFMGGGKDYQKIAPGVDINPNELRGTEIIPRGVNIDAGWTNPYSSFNEESIFAQQNRQKLNLKALK